MQHIPHTENGTCPIDSGSEGSGVGRLGWPIPISTPVLSMPIPIPIGIHTIQLPIHIPICIIYDVCVSALCIVCSI